MHDEFLTALRANPNDDVSRLVYADWLDEHDEPFPGSAGRVGSGTVLAEFLRLEVRLAAGVGPDERVGATNRLAELARRAEPGWLMAVNRTPFVRCAVRKRSGGSPLDGTLELANYATRALLVMLDADVRQYLRLTVGDPLGGATTDWYDYYPATGVRQLRLSPGERTSVRMNLLRTVPVTEITVGVYTVEPVYVYDGVQSRADEVRVEVTDEDRRRWKLGRFARE